MARLKPPLAANAFTEKAVKSGPIVKPDTLRTLDWQLEQLQLSAAVVSGRMLQTNRQFYGLLAEVYVWWRGADAQPGYLDAAYASIGKRFKKKVKHGINFAPLFWLAWGYDNDLTDDKAGRWSRVLNKVHAVYEAQKQYHTDSVPKLQNFIEQNGGVYGLVGYGSVEEDGEDDSLGLGDGLDDGDDDYSGANAGMPRATLTLGMTVDEMLFALYSDARDFYSKLQAPALIDFNATLPLTDDGMSLVLVRKVGDQYQLVGAGNDQSMVAPIAMQTYLHDYSALPQSIRAIVETISTQCLPSRLQSFYSSLVDDSPKVPGKASAKSVRRLMYLHDRGELVLSPIRAESGVVTIATPKQPVLENASRDVFLSTIARRALEARLVSGRDFNLFAPSNPDVVPEYMYAHRADAASHAVRLQNRFAERDYLHLDFWPFYDSIPMPHPQLYVGGYAVGSGIWQGTLSLAWFRKFSLEFMKLWIASHGEYIKREHQNVFRLDFGSTELMVHFGYRGGQFESSKAVQFPSAAAAGKPVTTYVLTKDFAVAMQAIADLGVVTAVHVDVDHDGLAFNFSTSAAGYRIHIPTCTVDGTRSTKHFVNYQPLAVVLDAFESYNDQVEGDFGEH